MAGSGSRNVPEADAGTGLPSFQKAASQRASEAGDDGGTPGPGLEECAAYFAPGLAARRGRYA